MRRNVENLRWAARQNLEDAFREFHGELDERLAASLEATRGAMEAALQRRRKHSEQIAGEAASARTTLDRLQSIQTMDVKLRANHTVTVVADETMPPLQRLTEVSSATPVSEADVKTIRSALGQAVDSIWAVASPDKP